MPTEHSLLPPQRLPSAIGTACPRLGNMDPRAQDVCPSCSLWLCNGSSLRPTVGSDTTGCGLSRWGSSPEQVMQEMPSALRLYLRSSSTWMLVSGRKSNGARLAGRSRLAKTRDRMRMEAKSPVRKTPWETTPRERSKAGAPPWGNHCQCGEWAGGISPTRGRDSYGVCGVAGPSCKVQTNTPPQD